MLVKLWDKKISQNYYLLEYESGDGQRNCVVFYCKDFSEPRSVRFPDESYNFRDWGIDRENVVENDCNCLFRAPHANGWIKYPDSFSDAVHIARCAVAEDHITQSLIAEYYRRKSKHNDGYLWTDSAG